MYDKRKFNKINDKKILRKSHKNWIVVSLSLLSLLGGGALVTTHVNADTLNNNINKNFGNQQQKQSNVNNTTTNKASLVNSSKDISRNSLANNTQASSNASNIQNNLHISSNLNSNNSNIITRASALHSKILLNNIHPNTRNLLGSANNSSSSSINKYEAEQNYRDEQQELFDVHGAIIAARQHSSIHVGGMYNQIFDAVPFNMDSDNTLNKQSVKLSPVPLVPSQDNIIPSNLDINNNSSKDNNKVNMPTPISSPMTGNNNNLIGEFANSDGTGGINATLYPNGTFLMSDGVEHTGYFSPATMKIGWPNTNGTQSDNSNYAQSIESDSDGAPHSKYNDDVISEQFNNVKVTGDMGDQFASQPNMRFFRISNCDFNDTYDYNGFFKGDNNLQSIQFDNTKGIQGSPTVSDSSSSESDSDSDSDSNDWDLVDPNNWVDEQTGDTNTKDMTNGDVWVNRKNNPITHIFSVPVKAIIQNNDGSTTTKQEYATIKGLVNNSTIVNFSQMSLDGYTPISTGHATLAFKAGNGVFYYTDNGSNENWINTNNNGQDPTLVVKFKPTISQISDTSSLLANIKNNVGKLDSYINVIYSDKYNSGVVADSAASYTINSDFNDVANMRNSLSNGEVNVNSSLDNAANSDVSSAYSLTNVANEATSSADNMSQSNDGSQQPSNTSSNTHPSGQPQPDQQGPSSSSNQSQPTTPSNNQSAQPTSPSTNTSNDPTQDSSNNQPDSQPDNQSAPNASSTKVSSKYSSDTPSDAKYIISNLESDSSSINHKDLLEFALYCMRVRKPYEGFSTRLPTPSKYYSINSDANKWVSDITNGFSDANGDSDNKYFDESVPNDGIQYYSVMHDNSEAFIIPGNAISSLYESLATGATFVANVAGIASSMFPAAELADWGIYGINESSFKKMESLSKKYYTNSYYLGITD